MYKKFRLKVRIIKPAVNFQKYISLFLLIATIFWSIGYSLLTQIKYAKAVSASITVSTEGLANSTLGKTIGTSTPVSVMKINLTSSDATTLGGIILSFTGVPAYFSTTTDLEIISTNSNSGISIWQQDTLLPGKPATSYWTDNSLHLNLNTPYNIAASTTYTFYVKTKIASTAIEGHRFGFTINTGGVILGGANYGPTSSFTINDLIIDKTPPKVESVEKISDTAVEVTFNEALDNSMATNPANYLFTGGSFTTVNANQFSSYSNKVTVTANNPISTSTTYFTVNAGIRDFAYNASSSAATYPIRVSNKVKISEAGVKMYSSSLNQFIELYNASEYPVEIGNWELQYEGAGYPGWTHLATVTPSIIIQPYSFYLLATAGFNSYSPIDGNQIFSYMPNAFPDGGKIRIMNSSIEVDRLGWGSAIYYEGSPAVSMAENKSLERKAYGDAIAADMSTGGRYAYSGNGWDNNNNYYDFVLQATSSPQSSTSSPENPGSGNSSGPMIMHTPVTYAAQNANLDIIARMGDSNTSINEISAMLYYDIGDGNALDNTPASYTPISGSYLSEGFFKFTIPQSDVSASLAYGLYYFLKVNTPAGSAYLSNNSIVDASKSETSIARYPIITAVQNSGGWTTHNISGTVINASSSPISNAIVILEGSSFYATTTLSGSFSFANVKDGTYNLVIVKDGYYDYYYTNLNLYNSGFHLGNITLNAGSGGGTTGVLESPYVSWSGPTSGTTGLPPGDASYKLQVGFSKDIDPATFNPLNVKLVNQNNISTNLISTSSLAYDPVERTNLSTYEQLGVIYLTSETLASSSNYYLVLTTGIRDTSGNALSGNQPDGKHVISFSTGGTYATSTTYGYGEMTAPYVSSVAPNNGNMYVPQNAKVNITFSQPMYPATILNSGFSGTQGSINLFKINVSGLTETKTRVPFTPSLDTTNKIALVTPLTSLTAGKYRLEITGALKSSTGVWMGDPVLSHNTNTYNVYTSIFQVTGTTDTARPTVQGVWPSTTTPVQINSGTFSVQFSESMDPASINSNTIQFKRGTTAVNGSISYECSNRTVYFTPESILAPGAAYALSVVGGATTSVTDIAGNKLLENYVASYTTQTAYDSSQPEIMYANADDYSIAITFSEPMNAANQFDSLNWASSSLNSANYYVVSLSSTSSPISPYPESTGVRLSEYQNLNFTYDEINNTVIIKGLEFYVRNTEGTILEPHATDFKIFADSLTDKSGNTLKDSGSRIDGYKNMTKGPVSNSSDTMGYLGPNTGGSGGMTGPSMSSMGMMKAGVFPLNSLASQSSIYSVEIPTTKNILNNYQIVLTFPQGFDIASARKETRSPRNSDVNETNQGTISFSTAVETSGGAVNDGVTVASTTRTVTVKLNVSGDTLQNDYLRLDLADIRNTSIPRNSDTGGYSVDIKILKEDDSISENIQGMPFYITQGGNANLTINLLGINSAHVSGNDDYAMVFLSSPMTGPLMLPTLILENGSGSTTISGLPSGQYYIYTDPFITLDGNDYAGLSIAEPIMIYDGNNSKSVILTSQASGAGFATVTVDVNGSFGTDDIDIFSGGSAGYKVKTLTSAGTNPTPVSFYLPDGNWNIGVMPSMPKGIVSGPPPMPDWMPPMPVMVLIDGNGTLAKETSGTANDGTIIFNIVPADKQIIGYVYDENSQPISSADVWAYQPGGTSGFGSNSKTDTTGRFILKLAQIGIYSVGAYKSGLPNVPQKSVSVYQNTGLIDGNTSADIYLSGNLITSTSPFIIKINKPGYTISGKITNEGNPVASAPVWASQTSGSGQADTMSDSSGNYILYVNNGSWTVKAYIPNYGDAESQTVIVNGTDVTQNLSLNSSLTYYTISGSVGLDSDGIATTTETPFSFLPIRAVEYNALGAYLGKEYNTVTDSNGNYSLNVPAGRYRVDVWTSQYGELGINNLDSDNNLNEVADDAYANNPANINANTSNVSAADIIVRNSSLRTIGLRFINAQTNQSGLLNITGLDYSSSSSQPTGFRKSIRINDLATTTEIFLSDGDYAFNLDISGIGSFMPDSSTNPNGRDAIKNAIVVSANRQVDFTITDVSIITSAVSISGTVYAGSAQAGNELGNAWVWVTNSNNNYQAGIKSAADGTYSLTVPVASSYRMGAEKPGYTSGTQTSINASTTISAQNFVLDENTLKISGYLYNDLNINGQYDSGESVPNGYVRAETTDGTKKAQAPADGSGYYELGVVDGSWKIYGLADGYLETLSSTTPSVSGSNITLDIRLLADSDWVSKGTKISIIPAAGGTMDDTDTNGTGIKLVIPPNALGNSNSNGNINALKTTAVTDTNSSIIFGGQGTNITATDNSGQSINNLNDYVDLEMVHYKSEIEEAIDNGELTYLKLKTTKLSYWDPSINDWISLATNRTAYYKVNASDTEWTLYTNASSTSEFETFIDSLINGSSYGDYKLVYSSLTNHFTIFAVVMPYIATLTQSDPPSVPILSPNSSSVVSLITAYCEKVEFDEWQTQCIANTQYRNILSTYPKNCTLTKDQESQRKRTCGNLISTISDTLKSSVETIAESISNALKTAARKIAMMFSEATDIAKNNTSKILSSLGLKRNTAKERTTTNQYLKLLTANISGITSSMQSTLTYFITYGTPTTKKIGEGERAGVLNSYKQAYGKLPKTPQEWSDAIKIANGRWPTERNDKTEKKAAFLFFQIYKRYPIPKNIKDDAAVKIIAYGLLPGARNVNSEKAAINSYKNIFGKNPYNAQEWNTVRAIAYSGAKR